MLNAYGDRVLGVAEYDETVSGAFQRVVGMPDRPQSLLRPTIATRVMRLASRDRAAAVPSPSVRIDEPALITRDMRS